jgi:hypothetical protein
MPKSANEVMQAIMFAAVVDGIAALKAASKGVPNTMMRDIQSLHLNTTFGDLPKELQDSISASVRSAFNQLLKEGYAVAPPQQGAPSRPMDRVPERDRERRGPPPGGERRGPRGPGGPGGAPRGPGGPGRGPGRGPGPQGGPGRKPQG